MATVTPAFDYKTMLSAVSNGVVKLVGNASTNPAFSNGMTATELKALAAGNMTADILAKDQNGNRVPFADSTVKVTVDGPAAVIGPTEFPLVGGDRAFWVRTTDKKGKIKITINASGIEEKTIELISE
mgnify:CR=1 FL=1